MTETHDPRKDSLPVPTNCLRDELLASDEALRNHAADQIRNIMVRYAANLLGAHRDHVNLNPESIAGSALTPLDADARACSNDEHLLARLRLRVWHTMLDRKKRPGHSAQSLLENAPETSDGPPTSLGDLDLAEVDDERFVVFLELLDTAATSKRERDLIHLYVVRALGWNAIALILEAKPSALKVALSRARPRLLAAVAAPLRTTLSAEDWAATDAILVSRVDVATACAVLGLDGAALATAFETRILPFFREAYGPHGVDCLLRLAGYARR
ncbi:MAG: hypothetical protein SGJ11_11390 [Phycisphaerae bacterium]|nr:hypothetical protein [Phycisphaerae bacterium]